MTDTDNFEGEELDIEPFEGEPDFEGPMALDDEGTQDDEAETDVILGDDQVVQTFPRTFAPLMAQVASGIRPVRETLEWYRTHDTRSEIGFDPDGMCLKVCRTARGIPARFASAVEAQNATPQEHRIHRVRDLRRGMVAYFDEPSDSNRFGHIVTIIGRVRNFNPDQLGDILVVTNSVESDKLTVVRGDYFERFWGDDFKFGATWLNGYELDVPNHGTKVERFHDTAPEYDLRLLERAGKDRPAAARALDRIRTQVNLLPDSPRFTRVRRFKERFREDKVLDLSLLNKAAEDSHAVRVRRVRDEIRQILANLPDE